MHITIDAQYCKGCALCVNECPKSVLVLDALRNSMGYIMPEPRHLDVCTGCRTCEWICPDMAITVEGEGGGR